MLRAVVLLVLLAGAGGLLVWLASGVPHDTEGVDTEVISGGGGEENDATQAPEGGDNAQEGGEEEAQERDRTPFAIDRVREQAGPVELDGKRAMTYLQAICDIGPRMSGTAGMRKQQELIRKHFAKLGAKIHEQEFTAKQVTRKNPVDMKNLIISWHPERKRRVILCSHYDTRPIADQEPDPRRWHDPFVSANDGGSGVAFLMELGHHMKDLKTQVGVDFVLFDGEEYVFERGRDEYFFGSKHFARTWQKNSARPEYEGAVLLDMIAGVRPRFPAEAYSFTRAEGLVVQLWKIARELQCDAFQNDVGQYVQDDHLALLAAGIPAVDLIDFSYPHWHRLTDVPANCSPDGIVQVGKVLTTWLQRLK